MLKWFSGEEAGGAQGVSMNIPLLNAELSGLFLPYFQPGMSIHYPNGL